MTREVLVNWLGAVAGLLVAAMMIAVWLLETGVRLPQ
jgi:hypothetical protein